MRRTLSATNKHLLRTADFNWEEFVEDPRDRRGRQWKLNSLLDAAWHGMLSGLATLRDVELQTEYAKRVPDTTLWDLLVGLDPQPFRSLLMREVKKAERAKELEPDLPFSVVAIDGKCVWTGIRDMGELCQRQSSKEREAYSIRVLRAQLVGGPTKLIIGQQAIAADKGEATTFSQFYDRLIEDYGATDLLAVITLDAGLNAKSIADHIHKSGRAYVTGLKMPQREISREAKRLLERRRKPDAQTDWEQRSGGRIRRLLFRTSQIEGFHEWKHLKQAWRIRQETERDGKVTVEERYFMTSLTEGQTKGELPLQLVRAHWAIENTGNWVLDTQWREDDCPWSSRAIEVVSLLRLLAYNVLTRLKTRRLRSGYNRRRTWRDIITLVRDALVFRELFEERAAANL
jgi:predicted transposase YbfD/YdcC